jgi:UDP-N-acetylglucosamine 2-epimerase (non-hydrolysing)
MRGSNSEPEAGRDFRLRAVGHMPDQIRVMTLFGTRPEAIKMAPVVQALHCAKWVDQVVVVTGQHREMLDQVLDIFEIHPDVDLDLMAHGQSLAELTGRALQTITNAIQRVEPDLMIVQGDTTSAFVGALAAFYEHVPVGHVEAGLRSFDNQDPFPEEVNRHLLSVVANLHFAPTDRARANLLAEGVSAERIFVTGNTVVDALHAVRESRHMQELNQVAGVTSSRRLILVTLHRRESWGEPMAAMCRSLRQAIDLFPDVEVLFPMHRNPVVREQVVRTLGDCQRVHLVEPLDYLHFVQAMVSCHFVVTDSGGIQEEAPALGKPVLVLRETTERPEAIEAGTARLVGTNGTAVFEAVTQLLSDRSAYESMAHAANPFGDGHAAERVLDAIRGWFTKDESSEVRLIRDAPIGSLQ